MTSGTLFDALPHAGAYRTIVADPPWAYPDDKRGWGVGHGRGSWRNEKQRVKAPYASMSEDAITALPVEGLAAAGSHLYLWTTNRHLHLAFHVLTAWGFRYSQTLVWAKVPQSSMIGGAFGMTNEYVLFGRRGSLATEYRSATSWFQWPRAGVGGHSRKPEAFLDLVEQVSPGPRVELFSRRARLGWDVWGNESLGGGEAATKSEAAA